MHGGQKYRSDDQIIIAQVKIRIWLTTVAARFAMIPVSRGSRTGLLEAVISRGRGGGHDRDEGAPRCPLWAMPAAGSLSRVGQHGIDQIYNHQHPQVWIGAAHCQTNHLASTAGHHAETQHYRPAGARTGLAAPRRPSLVVQKICRIARAVDDDDLAGTTGSPDERSDIRGRRQTNVTLPHVAPLMRATNGVTSPCRPSPRPAAPRGPA